MPDETIASFLDKLAARLPAPGGGATAALHAAQAAALLAMVARYSDQTASQAHAELIANVLAQADELRDDCLALVTADANAFAEVAAAYRLPKDTAGQQADRSAAISAALATASEPPAAVITAAWRLVGLAEDLRPVGNRSVLADVAAAAEAIRAAAATARVNVEANLTGITDTATRARITPGIATVDDLIGRADRVTAAVRHQIGR
jgi:methenyltetrahydrofolate cyclohydrolase